MLIGLRGGGVYLLGWRKSKIGGWRTELAVTLCQLIHSTSHSTSQE